MVWHAFRASAQLGAKARRERGVSAELLAAHLYVAVSIQHLADLEFGDDMLVGPDARLMHEGRSAIGSAGKRQ